MNIAAGIAAAYRRYGREWELAAILYGVNSVEKGT